MPPLPEPPGPPLPPVPPWPALSMPRCTDAPPVAPSCPKLAAPPAPPSPPLPPTPEVTEPSCSVTELSQSSRAMEAPPPEPLVPEKKPQPSRPPRRRWVRRSRCWTSWRSRLVRASRGCRRSRVRGCILMRIGSLPPPRRRCRLGCPGSRAHPPCRPWTPPFPRVLPVPSPRSALGLVLTCERRSNFYRPVDGISG